MTRQTVTHLVVSMVIGAILKRVSPLEPFQLWIIISLLFIGFQLEQRKNVFTDEKE